MKVVVLLADKGTNNPQAGTLNLLNAGWRITRLHDVPPGARLTAPHAVAVFFEVENQYCNKPIDLVLKLVTEDGQAVRLPGPAGDQDLMITQQITVVSPAGVPLGTPGVGNAMVEIAPGLPLAPGGYRWEVDLAGEHQEDWSVSFRVVDGPRQPTATIGSPPAPPPADQE